MSGMLHTDSWQMFLGVLRPLRAFDAMKNSYCLQCLIHERRRHHITYSLEFFSQLRRTRLHDFCTDTEDIFCFKPSKHATIPVETIYTSWCFELPNSTILLLHSSRSSQAPL